MARIPSDEAGGASRRRAAIQGRRIKMVMDGRVLRERLDALVAGMTSLSHDGRYNEPNLDGTPGDYISFNSWEWPQGVGLYGLVRLWQATGNDTLRVLLEDWYAARIAEGLPKLNINTTAPMLALSLLWRETRDPRWERVLDEWANRVLSEMPRTPEGGLPHIVSDKVNDNELWDDTIVMAGLFLASYGQASGRRELVDEACRQFLLHSRYLADPHSGLWFHGWTFDGRHNFARALWGRGNSWVTLGILDLVDLADIPTPVRSFLLGVLETQISALLNLQAPSGAWHTLLDDPSSYEEISATAGFGYGLLKAARLGLGPDGCRAAGVKALDAVLANIDETGTVANVSYGTRMGHDLQFYRDIPIQPTGYGQALAILCLAEALNHTNSAAEAA
jgi:unsaturated rhamnogalacturonyl hydrolase